MISKEIEKCDTAIIAKTQKQLQDIVNRLVDTGRKYSIEINIDKLQLVTVYNTNKSLRIIVGNREFKKLIILNAL